MQLCFSLSRLHAEIQRQREKTTLTDFLRNVFNSQGSSTGCNQRECCRKKMGSEIRGCSKQMVPTVVFHCVCQSLCHIQHGEEHFPVYKIIYCCGLLNQSRKVFSSVSNTPTFWSWRPASHSNEPDRFQGQRSTEAPGGGAFHRRDDRPHQPRVHPDPGGADRAAGTTKEESSAGMWGVALLCCIISEMLSHSSCCHVCKQVIYNWTIPVHSERSDQMLVTKTFEMLSRYSKHWDMLIWADYKDYIIRKEGSRGRKSRRLVIFNLIFLTQ